MKTCPACQGSGTSNMTKEMLTGVRCKCEYCGGEGRVRDGGIKMRRWWKRMLSKARRRFMKREILKDG
jgi:RecJ-like exonuclease